MADKPTRTDEKTVRRCAACGAAVAQKVCVSPAGYYVGTCCDCGPHDAGSGPFSDSPAGGPDATEDPTVAVRRYV